MFVPNGCPNSLHKTLSADPFLIPSYQILSSWEVMLFNLYFSQSLYSSRWLQLLVLPFLPSCWIWSLLWCLAAWSCFSILPTYSLLPENTALSSPYVRVRVLSVHLGSNTARSWCIPSGDGKKHPDCVWVEVEDSHIVPSLLLMFLSDLRENLNSDWRHLLVCGCSQNNLPASNLWFWHWLPWFQADEFLSSLGGGQCQAEVPKFGYLWSNKIALACSHSLSISHSLSHQKSLIVLRLLVLSNLTDLLKRSGKAQSPRWCRVSALIPGLVDNIQASWKCIMGAVLWAIVIMSSIHLSQLVGAETILLGPNRKSRQIKRSFLLTLQGYSVLRGMVLNNLKLFLRFLQYLNAWSYSTTSTI